MNRRGFIATAAMGAAALTLSQRSEADDPELASVWKEIEKRLDEAVQRLQARIRQPSIAAENRGMNEGCELTTSEGRGGSRVSPHEQRMLVFVLVRPQDERTLFCDEHELERREAARLFGQRSYRARLKRFGLERFQAIARQTWHARRAPAENRKAPPVASTTGEASPHTEVSPNGN